MSMKEAQAINIRKSNNRNCNSLRTNSIRGISLNHSSLNQQPSINSSNQFAKPLPKTLTVQSHNMPVLLRSREQREHNKKSNELQIKLGTLLRFY
jgi:hypothetical protein